MKKITKSYVERFYRAILNTETSVEEVSSKNPEDVYNDGYVEKIRFFDKECFTDDVHNYYSEPFNYSNWIYYGKRLSLEQLKERYSMNSYCRIIIHNMEVLGFEYVCYTQLGDFAIMGDEDITYNEYLTIKDSHKLELKK